MTIQRPDPDALLHLAQEEELREKRGKLKVFFGAAPGVGKTYTMLQDALARKEEGLDIVIGIVESHGRQETKELFEGFEILPRQEIEYRGRVLEEFSIDAALARQPGLILVDEMAHTNAPGCRHEKRWQDIKELIDRGMNVYTTLNVQHVESLNDLVAQITGVRVRETVPDSILEMADTIELVDLPPDDLLKRMQEGKVYFPEQAKLATEGFFRKSNLAALRELALRFTAERVNTEVQQQRRGENLWPTTERLLVCIGPGEGSRKLIRSARRLATKLQAEWIAVYVEAPRLHLDEDQKESAIKNLQFAEQLGADTVNLTGFDVVKEILALATSRNVSKIILGKQIRPRWKDILFGSLVDELVRNSGNIDIYIIREDNWDLTKANNLTFFKKSSWQSYLFTLIPIGIATIFSLFTYGHLSNSSLVMVYLLAVVSVSIRGEQGPAIFSSFFSVLIYAFCFIPPRFSVALTDSKHFVTLIVMIIVALIISHVTVLTRRQTEAAHLREHRIAQLHALTRQLATQRDLQKLFAISVRYISEVFDSEVIILLPDAQKQLQGVASHRSELTFSEKEKSVAQWSFDLGQIAGLGTQTLPFSEAVYLPLSGSQSVIGVLRVKPKDSKKLLMPVQFHLLEACVNQISLALEMALLETQKTNN